MSSGVYEQCCDFHSWHSGIQSHPTKASWGFHTCMNIDNYIQLMLYKHSDNGGVLTWPAYITCAKGDTISTYTALANNGQFNVNCTGRQGEG